MDRAKAQSDLLEMRKNIIRASFQAKEGHIPSAFSILEILYSLKLYNKIFSDNVDVILSKGHASLAYYSVLEKQGIISYEELMSFCQVNSKLGGHPDSIKLPEILSSTGSLGHGFPFSIGVAFTEQIMESDKHIFCIMGDGEFNEGTTWEGALLTKKLEIKNLTCVLDYNHSTTNVIDLYNIKSVFESLYWKTAEVDGHDVISLFDFAKRSINSGPTLLIANTIKGRGSKIMENNREWHHKFPKNVDELKNLLNSVEIVNF